jgi:lipid-A-disaccharide synthase
MPVIGIVAGEASGDLLGCHLIKALKQQRPDLQFIGIAGPKMKAEGAISLFPMERLAVRGYFEVLKHLWGLLRMRRELAAYYKKNPPDLFIGIDAPDFNLGLERKLKRHGIKTVHYVSPSIWAWRRGRIRKIKRAVSHILALFPFEVPLYEKAKIPVTYVGHPLADMLPLEPDQAAARRELKIGDEKMVIAMLPGSRQSELQYMADVFVKTAQHIHEQIPEACFLVPLVTRETRWLFEQAMYRNQALETPITLLFGHAHLAMEAADAVLVASGTATLEAALLKRPMVITYRMSGWSWQILRHMNYLPYVGLPNVLAGRKVVPELLQKDASPENIADTLLKLVYDKEATAEIKREFSGIHVRLRQNTADKAAHAILGLLS